MIPDPETSDRTALPASFSAEEVGFFSGLAAAPEEEAVRELHEMGPARAYRVFRRALILRLGLREERALAVSLDPASLPLPPAFGFRLREVSRRAASALARSLPIRSIELFPEDELLSLEEELSGPGFFKAVEFKAVDQLLDELLGLRTAAVHEQVSRMGDIHGSEKTYARLAPYLLLASYVEVQGSLRAAGFTSKSSLVDIGSGIGRVGIVAGLRYPGCRFVGYEVVPDRVTEAKRICAKLELSGVEFHEQDVGSASFALPPADFYFMYDPLSRETLPKAIRDLGAVARARPITVIATDGDGYLFSELRRAAWLRETVSANRRWRTRVFSSLEVAAR